MIRDRPEFRGFRKRWAGRGTVRSGPTTQKRSTEIFMKKSIKKLTLAKETLRNLNEDQMSDVAGGVPSKRYSDCGSCGIACTYVDCTT
jgi:natural product precursor